MYQKWIITGSICVLSGGIAYYVKKTSNVLKEAKSNKVNFDEVSRNGTFELCEDVELTEEECKKGIMVVGPPSSGKTQVYILRMALQNKIKGSVIFADPKGEIYENSSRFQAEICGRKVIWIDPFNPETFKINPLDNCVTPDDVYDMAHTMLVNGGEESDANWITMATPFFVAALLYAKGLGKPYDTIKTAIEFIDKHDSLEKLEKEYKKNEKENKWFRAASKYFKIYSVSCKDGKAANAYGSLMLTFEARTALWRNPTIENFTSESTFDIHSLRKEDMAVYFTYDETSARKLSPLLSIIFQQIFDSLLKDNKAKRYVWVCLDELANIGKLENINQIYSMGRSKNIIPVGFVQVESQMIKLYGEEVWRTIWSCVSTKIILPGINDTAFLEKASMLAGKHLVARDFSNIDRGINVNEEYKLTIDKLREMKIGEGCIIYLNKPPFISKLKPPADKDRKLIEAVNKYKIEINRQQFEEDDEDVKKIDTLDMLERKTSEVELLKEKNEELKKSLTKKNAQIIELKNYREEPNERTKEEQLTKNEVAVEVIEKKEVINNKDTNDSKNLYNEDEIQKKIRNLEKLVQKESNQDKKNKTKILQANATIDEIIENMNCLKKSIDDYKAKSGNIDKQTIDTLIMILEEVDKNKKISAQQKELNEKLRRVYDEIQATLYKINNKN